MMWLSAAPPEPPRGPCAHLAANPDEQQPLDVQRLHRGQDVEVGGEAGLDAAGGEDVVTAASHDLRRRQAGRRAGAQQVGAQRTDRSG